MRPKRLSYLLWVSAARIKRGGAVYFSALALMAAGMALLYLLLCGYFSFRDDMNAKIGNDAWDDVLIISDSRDPAPSFNEQHNHFMDLLDTPRGASLPGAEALALITPADLTYLEETFGRLLRLKASATVRLSLSRTDFSLLYLTSPHLANLSPQVDLTRPFLIAGREALVFVKRQFAEGDPMLRRFPYDYDAEADAFITSDGETAAVYNRDDFAPGDLHVYTYFDQYAADAEYVFILPFDGLFEAFLPADNIGIELRVNADNPAVLADFTAYMNHAHEGRIRYAYSSMIQLLLLDMNERIRQFTILTPMTLILLIMVSVNFMGMLYLNQRRQRAETAVRIACGAKPVPLALGALLSAEITSLAAALTAWAAGAAIVHAIRMMIGDIPVIPKTPAALILFALSVLLGALSALPGALAIVRLSPNEQLTSEAGHD